MTDADREKADWDEARRIAGRDPSCAHMNPREVCATCRLVKGIASALTAARAEGYREGLKRAREIADDEDNAVVISRAIRALIRRAKAMTRKKAVETDGPCVCSQAPRQRFYCQCYRGGRAGGLEAAAKAICRPCATGQPHFYTWKKGNLKGTDGEKCKALAIRALIGEGKS